MIEKINSKNTKFWIHRTLSEFIEKQKSIIEKISILNYQAENFDKMRPEIKIEVINEINKHMKEFGWNKEIIE